jgi:hypothetical protein
MFRRIDFSPGQRDFALIVLPALALLGCAFIPSLMSDSDTFWHLATGRWIFEHGRPPTSDPFSFTAAGRPWTPHEWLSEVILAGAYNLGGLGLVALITAGSAAAGIVIVALRMRRHVGPLGAILAVLAVVWLTAPSMLARPHALVLPILAGWTSALLSARERGRLPSLWLLPLMALWANLHGSYVLGIALIAPFALEALLAAEPKARMRTALTWGGSGLGVTAAAMLTPHGAQGLIFPFQLMSMQANAHISEWRAADFSKPSAFEAILLATLFACLWRGVRVPAVRLALLLLLLHMALQHGRHGAVLAVVGAQILAEPLARAYPPRAEDVAPLRGSARRVVIGTAAALAVLVAVARLAIPMSPTDTGNTPVTAVAHVPAGLRSKPVYNEYGFGGLLIFNGIRPFIDGRADMYGDADVLRAVRIMAGDEAAFQRVVEQYGIAWAIVSPQGAVARRLSRSPEWRRLYGDRYGVVFERVALTRVGGDQSA